VNKKQKVITEVFKICKEKSIKLLKVFDTNEHEPDKDVILGQWKNKKVVLHFSDFTQNLGYFRPILDRKNIHTKINSELENKVLPEFRKSPKINASSAIPMITATNTPARFLIFSNVAIDFTIYL